MVVMMMTVTVSVFRGACVSTIRRILMVGWKICKFIMELIARVVRSSCRELSFQVGDAWVAEWMIEWAAGWTIGWCWVDEWVNERGVGGWISEWVGVFEQMLGCARSQIVHGWAVGLPKGWESACHALHEWIDEWGTNDLGKWIGDWVNWWIP